jgi:hypothetical protein
VTKRKVACRGSGTRLPTSTTLLSRICCPRKSTPHVRERRERDPRCPHTIRRDFGFLPNVGSVMVLSRAAFKQEYLEILYHSERTSATLDWYNLVSLERAYL